MVVEIVNRQRRLRLNRKEIEALAEKTLQMENTAGDVSIVFVGRRMIVELNKQYFGKDTTTDVISFPLQDDLQENDYLGEAVVCTDVAADEAAAREIDVTDELYFYTVHGLLHILGYTDETSESRESMNNRARAILDAFFGEQAGQRATGES